MIKGKTLTPLLLAGIFILMLGLSFAAVPLYDLFCRVTGFGGTTQVSKEAPKIVLDKVVSVRFDTNVNNLGCLHLYQISHLQPCLTLFLELLLKPVLFLQNQ